MKKVIGTVLTVVMMGVLLAGCYGTCGQTPPPVSMKGEG